MPGGRSSLQPATAPSSTACVRLAPTAPGSRSIRASPRPAPSSAIFRYPLSEQFATIIGNPPYVRYQDVAEETTRKLLKSDLFDARSNLFLFFIEKCHPPPDSRAAS
jgi:adenine-specific DNA methylase